MTVNEIENTCQNCTSLKAQCDDLRSELGRLNLRLDEIVRSLSCDKISAYTQTAITLGESQEDSDILYLNFITLLTLFSPDLKLNLLMITQIRHLQILLFCTRDNLFHRLVLMYWIRKPTTPQSLKIDV